MYEESNIPSEVLLLKSAEYADIPGVEKALELNADINCCGSDLRTALHIAAENGHLFMAQFLVTVKGIKLNLINVYGTTPLIQSVYYNHYEITCILLEAGADPDAVGVFNKTALHVASFHGRIKFIKALIRFNANVNVVDCFDRTPLYMSLISFPSETITYLLLNSGADPNFKSTSTLTLLHLASLGAKSMSQVHTIATLIYFGGNVNEKDMKEETPLHKSALNGYAPLILLLVNNGADIYSKNIWGQKPKCIAKIHNNKEAMDLLDDLEDEKIFAELTLLNFPLNDDDNNPLLDLN